MAGTIASLKSSFENVIATNKQTHEGMSAVTWQSCSTADLQLNSSVMSPHISRVWFIVGVIICRLGTSVLISSVMSFGACGRVSVGVWSQNEGVCVCVCVRSVALWWIYLRSFM